jgi:hypothetical protein
VLAEGPQGCGRPRILIAATIVGSLTAQAIDKSKSSIIHLYQIGPWIVQSELDPKTDKPFVIVQRTVGAGAGLHRFPGFMSGDIRPSPDAVDAFPAKAGHARPLQSDDPDTAPSRFDIGAMKQKTRQVGRPASGQVQDKPFQTGVGQIHPADRGLASATTGSAIAIRKMPPYNFCYLRLPKLVACLVE